MTIGGLGSGLDFLYDENAADVRAVVELPHRVFDPRPRIRGDREDLGAVDEVRHRGGRNLRRFRDRVDIDFAVHGSLLSGDFTCNVYYRHIIHAARRFVKRNAPERRRRKAGMTRNVRKTNAV